MRDSLIIRILFVVMAVGLGTVVVWAWVVGQFHINMLLDDLLTVLAIVAILGLVRRAFE